MMELKIIRILAFLFCLLAAAYLYLHVSLDFENNEERIKVTVVEDDKTVIRELPLGSKFRDLGIDSPVYSQEYTLHDNETLYLENDSESNRKISINTAAADALIDLPGIGPVLAERIIEYRCKYGLFEYIEEIKNVSGIGDKKYEKIRDLIIL
ncbi:MAG: ComEA family DNA-binding protein [Erysipelotrichaceae bacterium]|nr:ComEA family DNA-binding protein [Erysipelotrichaceae bacterium]